MATYAVKLERSVPLVVPRHPKAPAEADFVQWCANERDEGRLLAVDLFSGAGGLGAGVEAAGWTVVAAVDNDRPALETHGGNFRGQAMDVDMSDPADVSRLIDRLSPIGIDLVVGGPPCQPFSRAGRAKIRSLVNDGLRDVLDPRKQLWRSFVEVVLALQPRAVLLENVPDMAIGDDLAVIRQIADILERAEYAVDYRLLDAWRHGVPQHRKRFILQARNDGVMPAWPSARDDRPVIREAIGDLPSLNGTTGARELPYEGQPSSALARELRGPDALGVIYDHMTRPVRDDDREAFELMTSSTLYSDLPVRLKRYRSDTFNDKYKRLDWDDLSRTITAHIAKDGYWYIHPSEHRTLTVREAARIQTFPDSFRFAGTRSDAFRQIGNAVPPLLGRAVAESIRLSERPQSSLSVPVPELRLRLEAWAVTQREHSWWLFPGPDMTTIAAAFAALLDVHQLKPDQAANALEQFRGAHDVPARVLTDAGAKSLTPARHAALQRAVSRLRATKSAESVVTLRGLLKARQQVTFQMLLGGGQLITGARVGGVVSTLLHLPEEHQKVGTDIKVALAQLVGVGDRAGLRMAAIRALTKTSAAALGHPSSKLRLDEVAAQVS